LQHFEQHVASDAKDRSVLLAVHSRLDTEQFPGEPRRLRGGDSDIVLHVLNRSGEGMSGYHYDPLFPLAFPAPATPRTASDARHTKSPSQSLAKPMIKAAGALMQQRASGVLANLKSQVRESGSPICTLRYALDRFFFAGTMSAARAEFRSCIEHLARSDHLTIRAKKKI
jgi:hypothetical protein